jgi:MerR family transcriptional regulator, light-induced transcriptional regulator
MKTPLLHPHKIGAVSSLSGVPAPTLRIWEARYDCFTPHKTEGKHRLYSDDDVLKATLLKRLTENGHSISSVAPLSRTALNDLLQKQQSANQRKQPAEYPGATVSMAVVGLTLASRIESKKFSLGFQRHAIKVTDIYNNISQALESSGQHKPQILLIQCNSLHAGVQVDIHRLAETHGAFQVIVLYSFGQEPIIEAMKRCGMIVRRDPISDADLADLINAVLLIDPAQSAVGSSSGTLIPPRKFNDMTLMRVSGIATHVLCECPRHVAEIIAQLASFEQYSHDCLNKSSEDAHIHAYLSSVSGSARALFESALEMVAQHEGIDLASLSK